MKFIDQDHNVGGEYKDGVFYKNAKGSKDKMGNPPGWAVPMEILNMLFLLGCDTIIVTDEEDGTVYETDYRTLKDKGVKLELGYGYLLPLEHWKVK